MIGVSIQIAENSQVAEARRWITGHARDLGFSETRIGALAIVVTEAATNLVKHAEGGELIARTIGSAEEIGMEILALDKGPGMYDPETCLRDGYSTAGSPGTGLGAIRRMSDESHVYSIPGNGTVLMARLWKNGLPRQPEPMQVEGISIPLPGEHACGDGWACAHNGERSIIMVVDGLGHGPLAATAAETAVEVFRENSDRDTAWLISAMHGALRSTRGAAVAIAAIDRGARMVQYTGVGNIAGIIFSPEKTQRMVSQNGTVGHEIRKIQEFTYPWHPESLLVMHSDGIGSNWSPDPYPGLAHNHPSMIAGIIYRDLRRGRDDATVVAALETETLP